MKASFYQKNQTVGKIMSDKDLRRYTTLSHLLDILITSEITFSNPDNWDDKNDQYGMKIYKDKKALKTLLAVCFTQGREAYHHWRVFCGKDDGVCIHFSRELFLPVFKPRDGFKHNDMQYKKLDNLDKIPPQREDLPFLKRKGYIGEQEYRIIYENRQKMSEKRVRFDINCIKKIRINPWVSDNGYEAIKETIITLPRYQKLKGRIFKSGLVTSDLWKRYIYKANF
jgi:hypothetical protein